MLLVCAAAALAPVQWLQAIGLDMYRLVEVIRTRNNTFTVFMLPWCMHAEQSVVDGPSTSGRTAEHSSAAADTPLATDGEDTIASLVTGKPWLQSGPLAGKSSTTRYRIAWVQAHAYDVQPGRPYKSHTKRS